MEAKEMERLIACAELRNPEVFNASRERYLAEISFKAGYEQVWKDGIIKHTFAEGKQAGRKEVVDWIEKNCDETEICTDDGESAGFCFYAEPWQAQKKEWGIK